MTLVLATVSTTTILYFALYQFVGFVSAAWSASAAKANLKAAWEKTCTFASPAMADFMEIYINASKGKSSMGTLFMIELHVLFFCWMVVFQACLG